MNNQAQSFKVTLSDWNGAVRGRPFRKMQLLPMLPCMILRQLPLNPLILIWITPLVSMIISKTGHALKKAMSCLLISVRRWSFPV